MNCLESHLPEDVLELYAMGKLSNLDCVPLEEHLLICTPCQTRLMAVDEFVRVIRAATSSLASHQPARIGVQSAYALGLAGILFILPAAAIVCAAFTLA